MILRFRSLLGIELLRVGGLNSIAVIVRLAAMLGINKILAIYVGPSGYAVIGQYQNFIQILNSVGSGAINTGIVKYTAEFEGNPNLQKRFWSTALLVSIVSSVIITFIIIFLRNKISIWLFNDLEYSGLIALLGFGFIFFVLNSFLLSILNGVGNLRLFTAANICGSMLSFLLVYYLAQKKGIWGALLALSIYQSISLCSTIFIIKKEIWFKIENFINAPDLKVVKNLGRFFLMSSVSAICSPLTNIAIRNHLIENINSLVAGYWDAVNRLSSGYLLIFSSVLSIYFLPKYSKINDYREIKNEIISGYKIIIPITIIAFITIYSLRNQLINILFTKDFIKINDVIFWYLCGDLLKIGSWIVSFLMLSKVMTQEFIALEIVFSILYVLSSFIFIDRYGFTGAGYAYVITYLLYWIAVHIIVNKNLSQRCYL